MYNVQVCLFFFLYSMLCSGDKSLKHWHIENEGKK